MEMHKEQGAKDMKSSLIGFGASPLGGMMGEMNLSIAKRAVSTALAHSISQFDTSPYYGNSESVLGECLTGIPRSSYTVCTKCGRYPGGEFDYSASRVTSSVLSSIEKLRCTYLDLVLVHDIEFADSLDQIVHETLPALQKLRERGLVKRLGISAYPLHVLRYVAERAVDPRLDVVLTYCHLNLADTSLLPELEFYRKRSIKLIVASVLSMGLFSTKGPQSWHPASEKLKAACADVRAECAVRGVNVSAYALRWALDAVHGYNQECHRGCMNDSSNRDDNDNGDAIESVLVGFASEEEVLQAVEVCDGRESTASALPDANLRDWIRRRLDSVPSSDRTWPSGKHPPS
eukprot:ANDGO_01739.mRNA.1 L-galactose dehydrogenase